MFALSNHDFTLTVTFESISFSQGTDLGRAEKMPASFTNFFLNSPVLLMKLFIAGNVLICDVTAESFEISRTIYKCLPDKDLFLRFFRDNHEPWQPYRKHGFHRIAKL